MRVSRCLSILAVAVFIIIISLLEASFIYAQEAEGKAVTRELVGDVTYYTPRNEPRVIGVADHATPYDMSFVVNADTRLEHVGTWHDLNQGDVVRVVYDEIPNIVRGKQFYDRIARKVSFVRAKKKETPRAEDEFESNALVSE